MTWRRPSTSTLAFLHPISRTGDEAVHFGRSDAAPPGHPRPPPSRWCVRPFALHLPFSSSSSSSATSFGVPARYPPSQLRSHEPRRLRRTLAQRACCISTGTFYAVLFAFALSCPRPSSRSRRSQRRRRASVPQARKSRTCSLRPLRPPGPPPSPGMVIRGKRARPKPRNASWETSSHTVTSPVGLQERQC